MTTSPDGATRTSGQAITIRGARQHNLCGVDLDVPKGRFTVVSGVSGSGKSSLAFDTLYAEGQRAYVESLSTYARQFLERLERPDVDAILGIQPAIAIRQRNSIKSSRSTVGTATEVYDYMRLLFSRVGVVRDLETGERVEPDTPDRVVDRAFSTFDEGTRLLVVFPTAPTETLPFGDLAERLVAQGYLRAWHDGEVRSLEEPWDSPPKAGDRIEVIADRIRLREDARLRLAEAVEAALQAGEGDAAVVALDRDERFDLSDRYQCASTGAVYEKPTPQLFSFNSPQGACDACNGFGERLEFDERRIVPDLDKTIAAGAIKPWSSDAWREEMRRLVAFCKRKRIPVDTPFRKLTDRQKKAVLEAQERDYVGILPWLTDLREHPKKEAHRFFVRRYLGRSTCRSCGGARLRREARAVRVGPEPGRSISELGGMNLVALHEYLSDLELTEHEQRMAGDVLEELRVRVRFLVEIGLGYLALDRASRTLSGGEMQRIHLSNALGGRLVETLYVLDEPSIGLHPRDTERLLRSLRELADLGNTVVVVEHDRDIVAAADHLVDLGPGAGARGGELLHAGPPPRSGDSFAEASLTCQYLVGERDVPLVSGRRTPGRRRLTLLRVRKHNLRELDVHFPLGLFLCVTGVSGSGKSTLVNELLYPALNGDISGGRGRLFGYDALHGAENVTETMMVDQSPIGRSARSNPATYMQVMGEIRALLAATQDAAKRGWTASRFSFNVPGGRCPTCQGMGEVTVEMHFMADLTVQCEDCHGRRFEPTTLEVRYRGRNVAEILDLSVDEAIQFFADSPTIGSKLWLLQRVGLGYLKLGQPASTLSGGESQRIKVARELMGGRKGHRLYLLDEPTTGLHAEDIRKLLKVLADLVEEGHTVLVIEHNLDVIKNADWVIDLGPGGGPEGGTIMAEGTPEEVAAVDASVTGQYLRDVLPRSGTRSRSRSEGMRS
ncbi:MAG TPA: excinuclease ABC subunit UvrA [Candidatus Krumholzibacteria bacterium]|nr:excinuclease ABC subunit UvrA [Candidatus Krumholzibacteria bacterium]